MKKNTSNWTEQLVVESVTRYYRRTSSSSPLSKNIGHMMFVDSEDEINGYGKNLFYIDVDMKDSHVISAKKLIPKFIKVMNEDYEDVLNEYRVDAKSLSKELNPDRIVTSAEIWDNLDLVEIIWNEILEPNNILVVVTNDGCLVFDEDLVKKK